MPKDEKSSKSKSKTKDKDKPKVEPEVQQQQRQQQQQQDDSASDSEAENSMLSDATDKTSLLSGKDATKEKKKKKPKEEPSTKFIKFQANTMDATILAASRLGHLVDGDLSSDDIIGYLLCILLHILAVCVQMIATLLLFGYTVEFMEDPYEPDAFSFIEEVLTKATEFAYFLNATKVLRDGVLIPLTEVEEGHIIKMCKNSLGDVEYFHLFFLIMFMGIVFNEAFKIIWRLRLICRLPSHPFEDIESEDEDGVSRDSLANKSQDHHFIISMSPIWKLLVFLIFGFQLIFLYLLWWTFAKRIILMHNVIKAAKTCLKISFLLKFVKMLFAGFAAPHVRRIIGDGGYVIPRSGTHYGFAYVWNTWLSTVWKALLAVVLSYWVYFSFFQNVLKVDELCGSYSRAVPYPDFVNQRPLDNAKSIIEFL